MFAPMMMGIPCWTVNTERQTQININDIIRIRAVSLANPIGVAFEHGRVEERRSRWR